MARLKTFPQHGRTSLTFVEKLLQLILSPVNGLFGLKNPDTGFVDSETVGQMFGALGVVFFIIPLGSTRCSYIPLAILIPSTSGHAKLAMPLLVPLADFAGVSRALIITAFQVGHGLTLMLSPTSVVLVGGLAIAKVGYDKYLRFAWPLLLAMFVVSTGVVAVFAS